MTKIVDNQLTICPRKRNAATQRKADIAFSTKFASLSSSSAIVYGLFIRGFTDYC